MPHAPIGRWITALVDEELDDVERDRVLNHLAGCQSCRKEANELRALKRRMSSLGETSADAAVLGRLIELARSDAYLRGSSDYKLPPLPGLRGDCAGPSWLFRTSWKIGTGSAVLALAAIGLTAFMLGGANPPAPEPKITPAVDTYWLQHSYDSGVVPAGRLRSSQPTSPGATGQGPAGTRSVLPAAPVLPGAFASGSPTGSMNPQFVTIPQAAGHTASPSADPTSHPTASQTPSPDPTSTPKPSGSSSSTSARPSASSGTARAARSSGMSGTHRLSP